MATCTVPKNLKGAEESAATAAIDSDPIAEGMYDCISTTGEKISIKKSMTDKIPYFQTFFRSEDDNADDTAKFKRPVKNEDSLYVLPEEIQVPNLKPILAYVETDRAIELFRKLSAECDVHYLMELFDFLLVQKPHVGDLDSIKQRTTEDIKDYDEKIARHTYEHHDARFGRAAARDAAAEFCIGLAMGSFDLSNHKDRQKVFNRMEFILSHPRTFRRRLRNHAKALADKHLTWITVKQKGILEKWATKFTDSSSDETSHSDTSLSSSPYEYNSSDFD